MNKSIKKRDLLAYIGDYSQVIGIKDYTFNSGRSRGIRAFDMKNGRGLELTVLADKSLNIPYLSFKGVNIGFVSKTGICAPEFYKEDGSRGFLQNFDAGFLTTCGITYMGASCKDDERFLGLHGPLANTPAEEVSASTKWIDDVAYMRISGKMREACVLNEYLTLERKLEINSNSDQITILDKVENNGFKSEPIMLLYHINFGYPFLDECTNMYTDLENVIPRDDYSEEDIENCFKFSKPIEGFEEQVFSHVTDDKEKNEAKVLVYNKKMELAVLIQFDPSQLPWLNHWKCPRAGDYVLGVEPSNCHVSGREKARKEGQLPLIQAGEIKEFKLKITFINEKKEIESLIQTINQS